MVLCLKRRPRRQNDDQESHPTYWQSLGRREYAQVFFFFFFFNSLPVRHHNSNYSVKWPHELSLCHFKFVFSSFFFFAPRTTVKKVDLRVSPILRTLIGVIFKT